MATAAVGHRPVHDTDTKIRKGHQHGKSSSSNTSQANTLADLSTCVRRTRGSSIPPPLVGFSSTVIGDHLYIFGGRLVQVRRMVSDLWALDLHTLVWEKLWPPFNAESGQDAESEAASYPQPRYFHSADAWGTKLVIFGGMGQTTESASTRGEEDSTGDAPSDPALSVLSDLLVYDTMEKAWSSHIPVVQQGIEQPAARYAHLSAITNGCLVIVGGQDILNHYIEQITILELATMTYRQNSGWEGHVGTYRSIAVSRSISVIQPSRTEQAEDPLKPDHDPAPQLSFSIPVQECEPVYTFTNYNFADVRRELDMISAPSGPEWNSKVVPLSDRMIGMPTLPPGLRFPTASMVGNHMVLTGTLITQQISSFAIWTLDLGKVADPKQAENGGKLLWQKVDAGSALRSGSWNRAVAWRNTVVVLGDRDREIAIDYNKRQNNFTHVALVDLETFGVYQPPPIILPHAAQTLALGLLDLPVLADFEIVCTDGVRLPCSRQILVERWPWFAEQLVLYRQRLSGILDSDEKLANGSNDNIGKPSPEETASTSKTGSGQTQISPHQLVFTENSRVGYAILQYFYALDLVSPLHLSMATLASMLLFARNFDLSHLRALVAHAMHSALTSGPTSAAAIYEAATTGGCIALQTRALKAMMSHSSGKAAKPRPPALEGLRKV